MLKSIEVQRFCHENYGTKFGGELGRGVWLGSTSHFMSHGSAEFQNNHCKKGCFIP